MENVIDFLKMKESKEQKHFDDIVDESEELENSLEVFGVEAAYDIVEILIEEFGCDMYKDPRTVFEVVSLVEHIKCMAYRGMGIEHPLQEVNNGIFEDVIKEPEKLLDFFMTGEDPEPQNET